MSGIQKPASYRAVDRVGWEKHPVPCRRWARTSDASQIADRIRQCGIRTDAASRGICSQAAKTDNPNQVARKAASTSTTVPTGWCVNEVMLPSQMRSSCVER